MLSMTPESAPIITQYDHDDRYIIKIRPEARKMLMMYMELYHDPNNFGCTKIVYTKPTDVWKLDATPIIDKCDEYTQIHADIILRILAQRIHSHSYYRYHDTQPYSPSSGIVVWSIIERCYYQTMAHVVAQWMLQTIHHDQTLILTLNPEGIFVDRDTGKYNPTITL